MGRTYSRTCVAASTNFRMFYVFTKEQTLGYERSKAMSQKKHSPTRSVAMSGSLYIGMRPDRGGASLPAAGSWNDTEPAFSCNAFGMSGSGWGVSGWQVVSSWSGSRAMGAACWRSIPLSCFGTKPWGAVERTSTDADCGGEREVWLERGPSRRGDYPLTAREPANSCARRCR
jgi:hypothetical protein